MAEKAIAGVALTGNALPLRPGKTHRITSQPYKPYDEVVANNRANGGAVARH